jgi:2-amino-4-hydroxy-6-hydroxymethyldihydropteridine diphosphokinase
MVESDRADPAASGWAYAIALGSNRGHRDRLIAEAVAELCRHGGGIALLALSRLHETAPVGGPPGQGAYLNAAAVVQSALGPHQLLYRLLAVESALGRTRCEPNAPRTIDLDLLARQDGLVVASGALTLPHPRIGARAFVLVPLAEVAPDWRLPGLGQVAALAAAFPRA